MYIKFYSDKSWQNWFKKKIHKQYMREVRVSEYHDGIIVNEKLHGS